MSLQTELSVQFVATPPDNPFLAMESITVDAVDARTGLCAMDTETRTVIERSFRLRHDYFVRRRRWVPEDARFPGLETDRYDVHAVHFAATCEGDVRAYLRALPFDPSVGFMLDDELSASLSDSDRRDLQRERALELSRLVCVPCACAGRSSTHHPMELLLRRLYRFAQVHEYRIFYVVVEPAWLQPFERRFGLPFRAIGKPYTFPDGTATVAAAATLPELENGMRRHSHEKFKWYSEGI